MTASSSIPTCPVERLRALTERQREVVSRVCGEGMTYREAGRALGISEQTVKNHVSALMARASAPAMTKVCAEWGMLRERERDEEVRQALRALPAMRADRT